MKMNSADKTKQMLKPKHIPQRSCVACKTVRNKKDLIRLVSTETMVEIDPAGKKSGRGAYLCSRYECWEIGFKKNCLEHALRTKINSENRVTLAEYAKTLPRKLSQSNE